MKETATHVELLGNLYRSEMFYSGLQHARNGMPVEMEGASESPAGSLFAIENINAQTGERSGSRPAIEYPPARMGLPRRGL